MSLEIVHVLAAASLILVNWVMEIKHNKKLAWYTETVKDDIIYPLY